MKGTSFQNGVEFKISIEGEAWEQGQPLVGRLVIQGKSESSRVILASATERKLKNKSPDAFEVLAECPGAQAQTGFEFALPLTARITDKAGSLYLLYGNALDPHALGRLRLNIVPHHVVQDLIDLLRTEFRFALKKATAGKKDFTEFELTPPAGKDWAQLDHLIVRTRIVTAEEASEDAETSLLVYLDFHRAEVDGLKAGLSTKITQREVGREVGLSDLVHAFNGRLNKDAAAELIHDMFEEYRNAGWLA
jgi:hypothetical protein